MKNISSHTHNILWAEDNEEIFNRVKKVLEEYLSNRGISTSITHAEDGDAVFRHLLQEQYALVILDIRMPRFNGLETVGVLASQWPNIRQVVISRYVDDHGKELQDFQNQGIIWGYFDTTNEVAWCESIARYLQVVNTWIFQGVPTRYDVAEKLKEGTEETWLVSRFREEIAVGDIAYLWRAGEQNKRGIYGWGTIIGKPKQYEGWGWGVPIRYEKRFPQHLRARELGSNPDFKEFLLFRMSVGTNFKVTKDEANALNRLIKEKFGKNYAPGEEY